MRTRSAPLLLAAFLVAPISAFGQGFSGPATITQPTTANHCVKIGPNGGNNIVDAGSACGTGAGTVTAVTGTANQINVATGTTTPALTLSSTIVTPGSLAVGAGSAITSSGPGGALASGAFVSTGTSGATVPLLNGTNTWSGAQTLSSSALSFTGAISGSGIFGTSGIKIKTTSGALSDTTSSGTVATNYNSLFGGNTQTATSATTITNNYGSYFTAPTCSTNVTCTNNYALGADSLGVAGAASISGTLSLGGTIIDSNSGTSAFLGSIAMGAVTAANGAVYLYRGTDNANVELYAAGQLGWSPNSNPTATVDLLMTRKGAASLQFGNVDAAAPVAQTLGVQSVVAGTSNTAGVVTTIRNSAGTGTALGGNTIFQYAPHDTTHAVTTFTGSASPYTIGFTAGNITTYPIGTVMTVSGCTTATLNGTYTVTASSSGSVTATTTATGTGSPTTCVIVGNTSQNAFANALTINGDTALIQLQGTSASFPAIKRNGANIEARLADDSAQTAILAATFQTLAAGTFNWAGRSVVLSPADGTVELTNNAQTGFTSLQLGGTTASFPSIKRNATAINFRLADDSADAPITSGLGTFTAASTSTNAMLASGGCSQGVANAQSGEILLDSNTANQGRWCYNGNSGVEYLDNTYDNTNGTILLRVRTAGTPITALTVADVRVSAGVPFRLKGYTVSTLPAGTVGDTAYVTDAVACTFLSTPTGSGSAFCPVTYDGSAWKGG